MENKAKNKIYKVTIDCGDGRVNEIEGEGIIAIGTTRTDDGTSVQCNIEGMHSVNTITAAISSMREAFEEEWSRAIMAVAMEQMFGKMRGDAEQPGEQAEEQAEEGNYDHVGE